MILKIKQNDITIESIEEIINDIKNNIDINYDKLKSRDQYLKSKLNLNYTWVQIIKLALYNLYYYKKNKWYIIEINPNIVLYGTNITLKSLVKLLEYGNLELSAYPLITTKFKEWDNYIKQNIDGEK